MRGAWSTLLCVICTWVLASSPAWGREPIPVKDKEGKTYALVVLCNDCRNGSGNSCFDGAEEGFWKGQPCGKCLLRANGGRLVEVPYDVHLTGVITDPQGRPVKDRFVKLFMQNGWGHRTRTFEDGRFRIIMGATVERKGKEPLVVDLGRFVDQVKDDKDLYFAMYYLSPDFKACSE
jgi:ribosomal protein S27E